MRSQQNIFDPSIFTERLRSRIKELGMTQGALAESTGIGQSTISRYINGKQAPELAPAVALASALLCDLGWLVGLEGKEDAPKQVAIMGGQDYINLPKGDKDKLSEPERATLGQALEVLRASDEAGGGYAKTLYQNIQMFHRGVRDARVVDQSPSRGAAVAGGSRAGRKKRSSADS